MKRRYASFLMMLLLMTLIVGCNGSKENYYKYKSNTIEETLYSEGDHKVPVLNVSLVRPEFKNNNELKILNEYLENRFDNAKINAEEDLYLRALDDYDFYYNEGDIIDPYEYNLYSQIKTNNKNLISILIGYETSYGTSHANYGMSSVNYDVNKEKLLDIYDIVNEEKINDLVFLIRQKLEEKDIILEDYQVDYIKECLGDGHIYFENDLVKFLFNTYDIASYAVGDTEIEFTKEELSDILLDDYR